jgi:hypothetical protein
MCVGRRLAVKPPVVNTHRRRFVNYIIPEQGTPSNGCVNTVGTVVEKRP